VVSRQKQFDASEAKRKVVHKKDSSTWNAYRVMVVDDNYNNLEFTAVLLKKYGFSCVTASSGRECLDLLEELDYDMILLDIQMPEMNGFEVAKRIRDKEKNSTKHVTVVAMTAGVLSGEKPRAIAAGMDDFLAKPVTMKDLKEVLDRFVPPQRMPSLKASMDASSELSSSVSDEERWKNGKNDGLDRAPRRHKHRGSDEQPEEKMSRFESYSDDKGNGEGPGELHAEKAHGSPRSRRRRMEHRGSGSESDGELEDPISMNLPLSPKSKMSIPRLTKGSFDIGDPRELRSSLKRGNNGNDSLSNASTSHLQELMAQILIQQQKNQLPPMQPPNAVNNTVLLACFVAILSVSISVMLVMFGRKQQ
jgi:CheY-like chemotaxis protein